MSSLKTAMRRSFTVRTALVLVLVMLLPVLCAAAGSGTGLSQAGYTCLAPVCDDAGYICGALDSAGFRAFPDEASLRDAVENGVVDCAVVIPENINTLLGGDCEEALVWITSPSALFPELRRMQAAAVLFSAAVPYRTAAAVEGTGITKDEIFDSYFGAVTGQRSFSFRVETAEGEYRDTSERAERYLKGALSLLLFTAISFGAAFPLTEDARRMGRRIGAAAAHRHILLPGMAVRCGMLTTAGIAGCVIGAAEGMTAATVQYTVCIAVFSLLLAALPGSGWKTVLLTLLSLASLALCPVFIDISLMLPKVAWLRVLLPPWWFWCLTQMNSGLLWLLIGCELLLIVAAELLLFRRRGAVPASSAVGV